MRTKFLTLRDASTSKSAFIASLLTNFPTVHTMVTGWTSDEQDAMWHVYEHKEEIGAVV